MRNAVRTSLRAALIACCALIAFAPAAQADIQTIRSADNEVWGAAGTSLFNYKEPYAAPGVADSEHGWIPSLAGGVSLMGGNDVHGYMPSNLYFSLDSNVDFGNAHYNGFLLTSPPTPYQSKTAETIVNVDAKLGKGFVLGGNAMVTPYGELDFRDWRRDLGSGQVETYKNENLLAGAMLQFAPTNRLVLSGYGAAGTTLGAQMKDSSGNHFNLGSSGVYKIGGKVGFAVAPRFELFSTLDYDHFHYTKSPWYTDAANSSYVVMEPTSRTEDTTLRVGMGYEFR